MAKNIALFFDGTANEIDPAVGGTNVVRLFRALSETNGPDQCGYYDPGVGTFGSTERRSRMANSTSLMIDRAFGRGIRANVAEGYRYLMRNYVEGDQIYLLGFSRGAYTARALAALLQGFGLLAGDRENLVDYAVKYFWKGSDRGSDYFAVAGRFKKYFSVSVSVHFLGLWDTVSAIGWARRRFSLPWTDQLAIVENGWHALAIDERRSAYSPDVWTPRSPNGSTPEEPAAEGDYRQVWFAGVHSDVGGTFEDHGLADIALRWIAVGAASYGLMIDASKIPEIGPDDVDGALHGNLLPWWWLAGFGRREIPTGSSAHISVEQKIASNTGYSPKNLELGNVTIVDTPAWP